MRSLLRLSCRQAPYTSSRSWQQTAQRTGKHSCRMASTTGGSPPGPAAAAKLQQNFNAVGVKLFMQILMGDQPLALPHVAVPDIRWLNWQALRDAGFVGCVFDKDNTLSLPFQPAVSPPLAASLAECLKVFGGAAVLYSNSAGLRQYDPQGHEAAALEAALGVHVLRHADKKPGGGAAELEAHFGCSASKLIMIGDRYLTDVVFGNRHGMMTVRPRPLTREGEPLGVFVARRIEEHFVASWLAAGHKPPPHPLIAALSDEQLARLIVAPASGSTA